MSIRTWKSATPALVLALAYFITGRLGLLLPAIGPHITLIWLPTGIAVAALHRYGYGCWPGVTLGAVAVNLAIGTPAVVALGMAVGNTLGPLLAAWMLRRIQFHTAFDRARDIMLLTGGAVVGMLVSSSLGVVCLSLLGQLPQDRLVAWLIWWAGDTMGVVTIAPVVFAFGRKEMQQLRFRRVEFFVWLGLLGLAAWSVFVLNGGSHGQAWPLAFMLLPLVAWAALRYGPVGTSVAVIVISVGGACGTALGHGPFYQPDPIKAMTVLWLFMATSATLGWLIMALHSARLRATGIQQIFEQAFNDVSLGMVLTDCDRRITHAKLGFTRLTGYTEAELFGKNCALLQGPQTDPAVAQKLKAALQGDGYFDGEILNYRKDGTTFWNALLISPLCDERGARTGFIGLQRDVTDRRQAESALRDSEARYRALVETSGDAIFLLDLTGRIRAANPAAARMHGYTVDELLTLRVQDLNAADVAGQVSDRIQRMRRGELLRFEIAHRRKDGTTFPVEVMASAVEIGGEWFVLGCDRDITERKCAEESLRESEERYRRIVNTAEEGVVTIDAEERMTFTNPKMARMLGYTAEEILGKRPWDFTDEEARSEAVDHFKQRNQGITERFDFKFQRKDGSELWTLISTNPIYDADGAYAGALAMITDITDRKQAVTELERSLAALQLFINTVPAYISFVDTEERYRMVNRRYEEYFGVPASRIVGQRLSDVQSPVAYLEMQPHVRAALAGQDVHYESNPTGPEGKAYWFDVQYVPRREESGAVSGFFVLVFDISQRRLAEIEREKLERKVQEAQKLESLGVLAGGIAHDFNNLLTAILGNASIAAMELPPGSPAQDCLAHITETSLRAGDLCKQMLAYSGRGRFVVQNLDLGDLVGQTAQMLKISISKKAELRFRLEKNLPPVEADATQIRQVIMNLVINASEAIGDQSGVISISTGLIRLDRSFLAGTLTAPNLPEGDYVFLEVADTGCGMTPETQGKIFDPFFSTKFTGRGLGLAAVLGIVRGHKGAMKVYSELGRGTTFKLFFPAASGAGESHAPAAAATNDFRFRGTVMVVDDEEAMRDTVARMLRTLGAEPVLAADGREAVEIFQADPNRFMLVLLDLTMPRMDGEQTFTELRRLRPDVRVVLMSGFNAQEAMGRFTEKGLAGFLQKPFTVGDVRALMRSVLA